MVDLSECPVLDHHAHAFLPEKEDEKGATFAQFFHWTIAPEIENENYVLYRRVLKELARVLKVKSKNPKDILVARNKAYHYGDTDPTRLTALLKDTPDIEVRIRPMR